MISDSRVRDGGNPPSWARGMNGRNAQLRRLESNWRGMRPGDMRTAVYNLIHQLETRRTAVIVEVTVARCICSGGLSLDGGGGESVAFDAQR